jgi:hypothetical protein
MVDVIKILSKKRMELITLRHFLCYNVNNIMEKDERETLDLLNSRWRLFLFRRLNMISNLISNGKK